MKISLNPKKTIDVGICLMDYNALIGDADKRNETFFSIIYNTFKESVEEEKETIESGQIREKISSTGGIGENSERR